MSQPHRDDRPESSRIPQVAARKHLPRYKVVLQQDGVTDLMFVVHCVMDLMRYPRAEATHKMWEAHHCGRSVLLTTYRERAELFVEQFAEKGLRLTLEPLL